MIVTNSKFNEEYGMNDLQVSGINNGIKLDEKHKMFVKENRNAKSLNHKADLKP